MEKKKVSYLREPDDPKNGPPLEKVLNPSPLPHGPWCVLGEQAKKKEGEIPQEKMRGIPIATGVLRLPDQTRFQVNQEDF